jgi:uncharacterized protein YjiS (DUF1127 family)
MEKAMSNVIDYHGSVNRLADRPTLGFGSPFKFLKVIAKRIQDRRELNYLLSLPDYQLKDIGLQRGDIQREVIKPLWRE